MKLKMTTVNVLTMVFSNLSVLTAGLEAFNKTVSPTEYDAHWFVDQHYPVGYDALLEFFSKQEHVVDSCYDRGLPDGVNNALRSINLNSDSYLVGYDPNSQPLTEGWVTAAKEVLDADGTISMVGVLPHELKRRLDKNLVLGEIIEVAGHRVFIPNYVPRMKIMVWRVSFYASNGLESKHKYYGDIEHRLAALAKEQGYRWGFLVDHYDGSGFNYLADPEYLKYKEKHLKGFKGSFEEYLAGL